MTAQDDRKSAEQTVRNQPTPDPGPYGGGATPPGRSGMGMGVSTGDYTEAPASDGGGPETTVTVGKDTGQKRDKDR
jgi:hypothetical protein